MGLAICTDEGQPPMKSSLVMVDSTSNDSLTTLPGGSTPAGGTV